MLSARRQAEDYAKALPLSEGWPPFLIVCDVGHCFEIYADFSGQGKNYAQFPDRQGFRIFLEDLRSDETRERLRLIWLDPHKLDPTKIAAKATREIAERLAKISKHLEEAKSKDGKKLYDPEAVALFLMRCLFTMFAEDVELLPKGSFRDVLKKCVDNPSLFPRLVGQLWEAMDTGGFSFALERDVRKFNGYLFKNRTVFPLPREEIGELFQAAKADWKQVEPAIFGTLLEQALNPGERRKLGAHYTPRAYVERRRRDRAGAVKSRMGRCSGDGGNQARRRRRQGRASGDTGVSRTALRDEDSGPRLRDGQLSLRLARIDEAAGGRGFGGAGLAIRTSALRRL
jgi:hypothetical protein